MNFKTTYSSLLKSRYLASQQSEFDSDKNVSQLGADCTHNLSVYTPITHNPYFFSKTIFFVSRNAVFVAKISI